MPRPRPDALLLPKISWTQASSPAGVSYGALVGTPRVIILLPRAGTETAGFTLSLEWTTGGASIDDIARLLGDGGTPTEQVEQILVQGLPEWPTRCVFPVADLSRLEILSGWKLWLGVSAVLQLPGETPTSLRVPDKKLLAEMREVYGPMQRG